MFFFLHPRQTYENQCTEPENLSMSQQKTKFYLKKTTFATFGLFAINVQLQNNFTYIKKIHRIKIIYIKQIQFTAKRRDQGFSTHKIQVFPRSAGSAALPGTEDAINPKIYVEFAIQSSQIFFSKSSISGDFVVCWTLQR